MRDSLTTSTTTVTRTVVLLTVISLVVLPWSTKAYTTRDIYKRSFVAFNCMGKYDVSLLAKLERVCSDCFNLYREPELTMLCSKKCFVNEYFDGCLDALVQEEERKILKKMREALSRGTEN
ncbi:ITP (predicted) [Pycnogonum litorale]